MTFEDFTKFLPYFFSTVAMIMSFSTFYNQYFKKPEFNIVASNDITCWQNNNKHLVINSSFTLFNKGAQYGAIYRISGKITPSSDENTIELNWRMFVEDKNVATEGEEFKPFASFAGWADTILIAGRTAVVKKIQFVTTNPVELKADEYELEWSIYSGTDLSPSIVFSTSFQVTKNDIKKLQEIEFDPIKKIAKSSHRIRLQNP